MAEKETSIKDEPDENELPEATGIAPALTAKETSIKDEPDEKELPEAAGIASALTAKETSRRYDDSALVQMCKDISTASRHHDVLVSHASMGMAVVAIGVLALMRFNKGADGVDFLLSIVLVAVGMVGGYNTCAYPSTYLPFWVLEIWQSRLTDMDDRASKQEKLDRGTLHDDRLSLMFGASITVWVIRLIPRLLRALLPLTITAIGAVLAIVHYPSFKDLLIHSNSFQEVMRQLK